MLTVQQAAYAADATEGFMSLLCSNNVLAHERGEDGEIRISPADLCAFLVASKAEAKSFGLNVKPPRLLKANDAAVFIGVSLGTLYHLRTSGLLNAVRCGVKKGYRWTVESLLRYLETRHEPPAKQEPETKVEPPNVRLKHIKIRGGDVTPPNS